MRATLTLLTSLSWILALTPSGVYGQETNAVCMDSFSWAFNSLHQSPCQVASSLLGQCTANTHVDALPEGSHYGGPTSLANSNPCQCNTVTFSLLSACGSCQNRTIEAWSVYSAQCSHVYAEQFPEELPETPIPGWAFLGVKAKDGWDVDLAKANANLTEVTRPKPAPSNVPSTSAPSLALSSGVSSSTAAVSSSTPGTQQQPAVPQYSEGQSRAIIGGIVGGTCGVMLLLVVAFVFKHHRDSRARNLAAELRTESEGSTSDIAKSPNLSGTSLPTKETA